jgi:hypothetical protein
MFLATNAIRRPRQTRQGRQSTMTQILNKTVQAICLISFMSGVAACSGVPLIPGI